MEELLFSAETYNDIKFANEKNLEFTKNKIELDECLKEWEKISSEIQAIEAKFS